MCAAVTAAGAITAKYADVDSTTLTKTLSGGVWNTNLVISLVTGVASSVVYSVAASPFDTAKLTAVLWLASVLIDLKDASYDIGSLKDRRARLTRRVHRFLPAGQEGERQNGPCDHV